MWLSIYSFLATLMDKWWVTLFVTKPQLFFFLENLTICETSAAALVLVVTSMASFKASTILMWCIWYMFTTTKFLVFGIFFGWFLQTNKKLKIPFTNYYFPLFLFRQKQPHILFFAIWIPNFLNGKNCFLVSGFLLFLVFFHCYAHTKWCQLRRSVYFFLIIYTPYRYMAIH